MMEILRRHGLSIAFMAVLFAFLLVYTGEEDEILQLNGYTMGTSYQLQFVGLPDNVTAIKVEEDIRALLNRLDRQVFSTYEEQSELSRFNRSPIGQPFRVSAELLEVMQLSRRINELSGGAFDVTVGPLVNLWGFGPAPGEEHVPETEQIAAAMARIGMEHVEVIPAQSVLIRRADVYVDLSGIAKGYVVDQTAAYFDSIGITDYFLEIGGELKISGVKPGDQNWVPAVEKPVDGAPQVYQILNTQGEALAIAGSGDYRNYFEVDGIRYSHEIDPRTGRPVNHNLAAVYVIDREAARADALATAFMVLGFDQGLELAEREGLAVYFIVRNGSSFEAYFTEQFDRYLRRE